MLNCVKGKPEAVSRKSLLKGLHTDVYRVDDSVFKVKKWGEQSVKAAKARHHYLKRIREKFSFFPEYFGTILGAVEWNGKPQLAVASFHEYAQPVSFRSLKEVEGALTIIVEAQSKGYFLDLKPTNFGKVGDRILYLDEYGVGRTPIPPDLLGDLDRLKQKLLVLSKKERSEKNG